MSTRRIIGLQVVDPTRFRLLRVLTVEGPRAVVRDDQRGLLFPDGLHRPIRSSASRISDAVMTPRRRLRLRVAASSPAADAKPVHL